MIVIHTSGWILIGDNFKTKRKSITLRKCGGFKLNDQQPGTALIDSVLVEAKSVRR